MNRKSLALVTVLLAAGCGTSDVTETATSVTPAVDASGDSPQINKVSFKVPGMT